MSLEVSYWTGYDPITRQAYGKLIASESVSLGATTTDSGTIPASAAIARLYAGENCRVTNNGSSATATNGTYIAAGGVMDLQVTAGGVLKGMTA